MPTNEKAMEQTKRFLPRRKDNPMPVADEIIARRRGIELAEQEKLRETICERVGRYRADVIECARRIVDLANDAREIGLLIIKDWERLPGRQMTIDFWQQQQAKYVDAAGSPILLDQLKWFVKIAHSLKTPLDHVAPDDVLIAFSHRKELLWAGGLVLMGDAPSRTPAGPTNYFLHLNRHIVRWDEELKLMVTGLEADQNFGPILAWPAERREIFRLKVEPLYRRVAELYEQINAVV